MRKVISLILASALVLSLAACGSSGSSSSVSSGSSDSLDSVSLPKNIEVQVPAAAGGGTDVMARALSTEISQQSGSNVTVVNNTDGSGVVAMETVRTAKPDGSKILQYHTTMLIKIATGVYDKNASEDFKVIGVSQGNDKATYTFVVGPDRGWETLDDFLEAAKSQEMKLGVETGATSHILTGLFVQSSGINARYVEAGSDTEKLTALVGNTIDGAIVNANQAKQYVESGKAVALAVVSNGDEGARSSVLPDVPSFQEQGIDCCFAVLNFFLGPKDMSDDLAKELYEYYDAAAKSDNVNDILGPSGMDMYFMAYEDGPALIAEQQETINELVEELGLVE